MSDKSSKTSRRVWTMSVGGLAVVALLVCVAVVWFGGSDGTSHSVRKNPDNCRLHELPQDRDDLTSAAKVSPNGEFIAGNGMIDGPNGMKVAGVWHDGDFSEIVPPGEVEYSVNGVNDSGVAVGTVAEFLSTESSHPSHEEISAWKYEDGDVVELTGPDGVEVNGAYGISKDGTIVGSYTDSDKDRVGIKWMPGETDATVLEVDDGKAGGDPIVATTGTIMGSRQGAGFADSTAWTWDAEGNGRQLTALERGAEVKAISGDWVLLEIEGEAFRWNMAKGGKPEEVPHLFAVYDIDTNGRVYGSFEFRAGMGDADSSTKLDGLTNEKSGVGEEEPQHEVRSASADGSTLVGSSTPAKSQGRSKPVEWICT